MYESTRATSDEVMAKLDRCAGALAEARRLLPGGARGSLAARLLLRAGELLEELDEILLVLDHTHDRSVFERMTALRVELRNLESYLRDAATQIPPMF